MPKSSSQDRGRPAPLELLFQAQGSSGQPLPADLQVLYGGQLDLGQDLLYANFVTSLDGVAVLGPSSGSALSGHSQADRLVMGLLRSCAEAILIGSATLSGSPGHVWTPAYVLPALTGEFAELRRRRGLTEPPKLVVVTGSGRLELNHPGLARPALILTSKVGATRLAGADRHLVVALGEGPALEPQGIVEAVRQKGYRSVLCEGGPRLLGGLVQHHLLDQLFLTLSPLLAGRTATEPRSGLVAGVDLLQGDRAPWSTLLSARRDGSHLFLQYRLRG